MTAAFYYLLFIYLLLICLSTFYWTMQCHFYINCNVCYIINVLYRNAVMMLMMMMMMVMNDDDDGDDDELEFFSWLTKICIRFSYFTSCLLCERRGSVVTDSNGLSPR